MFGRILILTFFTLGVATTSSNSFAQDVEQMDKFGIWSVYCIKGMNAPKYGDCSIVTGGHSNEDAGAWAKIAIALTGKYSDPEMTVRIPFIKNIGEGISMGFDGRQVGRSFIRTCSIVSCEATVKVDDRMNGRLGAPGTLTVEYKVSDDKSVVLQFNRDGLAAALTYLNKLTGLDAAAVASATADPKTPLRFIMERRVSPYSVTVEQSTSAWDAPLSKCFETPSQKEILVSVDMRVENGKEFDQWLDDSKRCANSSVIWIKPKSAPTAKEPSAGISLNDLGSWTLQSAASKKMPIVAISPNNKSRVPMINSAYGQVTPGNPLNSYNLLAK
jgi:invasion protein IalB